MNRNEQVVRDAFAAFTGGDVAGFVEMLSDDFVIHITGNHRVAGDHGKDEFLSKVLPTLMEITGGTLKLEAHDFLGSEDHAVGIYQFSAQRDGKPYTWRHVNVYHVRDDKITEVFWNPFDQTVVEELLA